MKITDKADKKNNINLNDINATSKQINTDKISNEILDWLIKNVEYFIDNQTKSFKVDLIIDGESDPPMPESRLLSNLFRQIPDDYNLIDSKDIFRKNGTINMKKLNSGTINKATDVRNILNEITKECLAKIQSNEEKLKMLYDRMIFYYEMIGFHNGNPLLREISGAVNITNFEYEAFSVDVKVKSPTYQICRENGTVDFIESDNKTYTVPEGFTIWIEIAFAPKAVTTSLF